MSQLEYSAYPGFGDRVKKDTHYSQAVKIGNIVKTSGQGGWDRQTEEIPEDYGKEVDQAFENVKVTLEHAGSKGWPDVYQVRVYIKSMATAESGHLIRNLRKWCPDHQPLLTVVGVEKLYGTMRIEIEVEACVS